MPSKVFISYRRDDAKWQAREIYRALTQVLPRDHVFMDIDSIPPGADFVDILEGWVEQSDILLALIGSGWVNAMDPKSGRRRLENPDDFVRIEVRKGLARGIPVVPVLLDGAAIPEADQLPDDLKKLVRRHAEFIEHRTVDTDVERLIKKLRLAEGAHRAAAPRAPSSDERMRGDGRILVDAPTVHNADGKWFKPGAGKTEWFKDHEHGPEMVVVPAGVQAGRGARPSGSRTTSTARRWSWFRPANSRWDQMMTAAVSRSCLSSSMALRSRKPTSCPTI